MKSLKLNLLVNVMNQLLGIVVPLVTTPYLARVLGASKLGEFSYANCVVYYFTLFGILGLANYGTREIAKVRDVPNELSRTFSGIYTTQVLCSATVTVMYCVYAIFIKDILATVMLISVISVILDINWFYYGLEKFDYILLRNVLIKFVTTVCIFIFVKSSNDAAIYAFIVGVGSFLGNLTLWQSVRKKIKYVRPSLTDIKKHLISNLTLFLPIIVLSIYKVMDKIMLKWMTDYKQVGYYESADKIGQVPLYIISALSQIMIPRISFFASKEKHSSINDYFSKSIMFISFLSTTVIFGVVGVAGEFVPLYFGKGYESCIKLILVLLPSYIFTGYANVFRSQLLIPFGKDREFAKTLIFGAIINFVLNIVFIPKLLALGAAIATAVAEFAVFARTYFFVKKEILNLKLIYNNVIFYISGFVMLIAIYFIPTMESLIVSLAAKVVFGAVVYIATLFGLFFVRKLIKL